MSSASPRSEKFRFLRIMTFVPNFGMGGKQETFKISLNSNSECLQMAKHNDKLQKLQRVNE